MIKQYIALIAIVLITLSIGAQTKVEQFKSDLAAAADEASMLQVINQYLPKLSSAEDLRELQNVWNSIDPQACSDYFKKAAAKEPKSPVYAYLKLRFEDDAMLQYAGAVEICKKHPDFYWGYRLLSVNMAEMLLNEEKDSAAAVPNKKDAFKLLDAGIKRYPEDTYLNLCQFHRYRLAGNKEMAEQYISKVTDSSALYSNWSIILDYIVKHKSIKLFESLITRMLDDAVAKGQYSREESKVIYQAQWLDLQLTLNNLTEMRKYFSDNPKDKTQAPLSRYYEGLLLAEKRYDELLNLLASNLDNSQISIHDLKRDERFSVLGDNPRWKELLTRAELKWNSDEPKRKLAILEGRMAKAAPLWELPNAQGETVKLADYRGQIVVLDFWATWCSPCRMAMPALDQWMKSEMPAGVRVFSINVWENADEKAKAYFDEHGFAMTLLFAEDSISNDYGFSGIPYICVIDKQGRLAYAQAGFSDDLESKLSYWVEALAGE